MHKKQKMNKERTQYVNVENPTIVGKTMAAHRLQKITMRGIQQEGNSEATTSLTPSLATRRLQWRQQPLSLSLSLFVTIHSYTHYVQLTMFNYYYKLFLP